VRSVINRRQACSDNQAMPTDIESPHGKALRKGRYSQPGSVYLLTSVTQGRMPHFEDWRVGRLLVSEFRRAHEAGLCESMAFVVMPDHFHWLITLQSGSLAALMGRVRSRSAIAVNRVNGMGGQLWQRGYHDHALRKEEDLPAITRYVVANPLRAGLVKCLGDYPMWDARFL
jgi:putative transposase